MKPSQVTAILAYGTSQASKARAEQEEKEDGVPVLDVTEPHWHETASSLLDQAGEGGVLRCTREALMLARKRITSSRLITEDPEDQCHGTESYAVRVGNITVSSKVHPAAKNAKAWLSPYHISLIKELFGEGYVIEILDENSIPVDTLGEK